MRLPEANLQATGKSGTPDSFDPAGDQWGRICP